MRLIEELVGAGKVLILHKQAWAVRIVAHIVPGAVHVVPLSVDLSPVPGMTASADLNGLKVLVTA